MIDYTYVSLYYEGSINKQLNVEAEDGTVITNTNIYQEEMSLEETLCSEESLTFGCCEASVFKLKIANRFTSLYDQKLAVAEILNGNTDEPFQFGIYKVAKDTPTADRIYRNITAYDAMYDIINADATVIAEWYNTILPDDDSTVTMKEFRTSFLELFGIEQEDATLVNDDMSVEKTISTDSLSGKDVICAICEINGCFGHIGRNGKFQYIYLEPISESESETATLGTMVLGSAKIGSAGVGTDIGHSNYKSCDYEDYTTTTIDKLQIRQEEDDVGCTYGDGNNCYIIDGNFLVYGKSSSELSEIAANIYTKIAGISYRPTSGIVAIGNPCIEVGDGIFLSTKYQDIATYVLQRTLKGIQALEDTYEANGTETCENTGNSLTSTITQLKGKTNVLTRTVEETKSQISDVEEGLTNTITQTADSLKSEISKVSDSVSALESAAITGSVTEYYKSTSATELSGGEWSETSPEWEDGTYIWMRTTVTYGTGESSVVTVTTDPVCITGNTGARGEQGIQGLQGIQGEQGEQGIQGETGADGKTSYFHIKYSDVENPTTADEMTETPSDYIGTYVDYTEDDSTDPADYTWMKWVGEDGAQGIQGVKGDDGTTYYLHIAYANSEDGSTDFSVSDSANKTYIGQYTDTEIDDSTDYTKYSWTKIKGDAGESGVSVVSVTAYYAVSESSSYYPAFTDDGTSAMLDVMVLGSAVLGNSTEWSEAMPEVEDNEYLWIAFLVTYSNGVTQWTEPCLLTDESTREAITILQEQNSTFEQTLNSFEFSLSSLDSVVTENYEYTETRMSEFEVTLNGLSATASETLEQVGTLQTEAVTGTVTEYYKSTSSTECTGGEWAEDTPEWEEGYYIWVRTTVSYGVGEQATTQTTDPVCITGNTGATGSSGNDGASVTISNTAITYQASSSGTTTPTGTWSSSIPSVSKGQYLWTRTVVTYTLTASDGTTSTKSTTSYSVAYIGEDGAQGDKGDTGADGSSVTIQSTKVTYQATSSGTETPSGTWSESVPEMSAGQYLWTRTEVTYLLTASDGTTSTEETTSYSVSYIGVDGEKGDTGDAGVSVESVTIYYALSESSTYAPSHGDDETTAILGTMVLDTTVLGNSGEWYTEAPEVGETEYLWSCFLITYSNGVTSWTEPCCLTDDSTRNLVSSLSERTYEFEASLDRFTYVLNVLEENIYENYSTTQELEVMMDAKIEDSEASITEGISAKYATIEYADKVADAAEAAANDATDTKLAAYTTTTDMNTAINQAVSESEASIMETVSATYVTTDTLKGYSTTTDMNTAIGQAVSNSEASIKEEIEATYATIESLSDSEGVLLGDYSTTTQMDNAITQAVSESANTITAMVSTVEKTVNGLIKEHTTYYAVSESSSYYPTMGDDGTASSLGTAVLDTMVLGNSGVWTTDRPQVDADEYLWQREYILYADGAEEWTTPALITDESARTLVESVIERTSALEIADSGISAAVTYLSENLYNNYSTTKEVNTLIEEKITDNTATITSAIEATYATKEYADQTASDAYAEAYADANEYTDGKLELYSTTETMKNTITQYISDNNENYVDLAVSTVQKTVNGTIKSYEVYYAVSESPDYYPTRGGDTTSILGTDVLGTMILGNSGTWSTTQPDLSDGEYCWVSYYLVYANGDEEWTTPTLLTDAVARDDIYSLNEKYAELLVSTNSISMSVTHAVETAASYTDKTVSASLVLEIVEDEDGNYYGKLSANADYIELNTGDLVINSEQLTLDKSGNAKYAGELSAATGTFAGELTAATGTFKGQLVAATGTFAGSLAANVVDTNSIATGAVTADKIEVTELSAICADVGELTAGIIRSENYTDDGSVSGNAILGKMLLGTAKLGFNGCTGVKIDLDNGTFKSPNFEIDSEGNATYSGKLAAASGTFEGDVYATTFTLSGASMSAANAGISGWAYSVDSEGASSSTVTVNANAFIIDTKYSMVVPDYVQASTIYADYVSAMSVNCGQLTVPTITAYDIAAYGTVYYNGLSAISTSDRNDKTKIVGISEKYEQLFMKLRGVNYMWRNASEERVHDRVHCGLIAQEVEQACIDVGLDSTTFATLCYDDLEEPLSDGRTRKYGLAYSELHGLEIHMIQKNAYRLESAEERIAMLETKVAEQDEIIRELHASVA